MFNLEKSIEKWRRQMLTAGIKTPAPLNELEIHLREEMERQIELGAPEQQAFALAMAQIGEPATLKTEFRKVDTESWNRPLAIAAWITFSISIFLPSFGNPFDIQLLGYQCAIAQTYFWPQAVGGNWISIHYELLTLANGLMLVSPFCLAGMPGILLSLKAFRYTTLAALILVWSFVLLVLLNEGGHNLKAGCYVWAFSFLLLHLSGIQKRAKNVELTSNI